MTEHRKNLPSMPARIRSLPVDGRGYPIPWFVFAASDGTRDFRIADGDKRRRAAKLRLCWICGQHLGRYLSFVIGPMCAINRNTSEPACHYECARFAALACPFLILPKAQYRRANLPSDSHEQPHSLPGNPGACAIWVTHTFRPYYVPGSHTDWLIELGEPVSVHWFTHGRYATRAEIVAALDERLPLLSEVAARDGVKSIAALRRAVEAALPHLPAGSEQPAMLKAAA